MRRGRIFFYIAFVIIILLIAVVLVYQNFFVSPSEEGTEATPTPIVELTDVVILKDDVKRGDLITEESLDVVKFPTDVSENMFSDANQVLGLQAKFDLASGTPLNSGMLVSTAEQLSTIGSNAALAIPRGMVAVSIPTNRLASVSYAIRPGDHVNVMITYPFLDLDQDFQTTLPNMVGLVIEPGPYQGDPREAITAEVIPGTSYEGRAEDDPVLNQTLYIVPSEPQRPRIVSQNILQDVIVLGLGDFLLAEEERRLKEEEEAQAVQPQEGVAVEGTEVPPTPIKKPDLVTLIVSPQDAVTLNYLIFSGAKISLALRSVDDDTRIQTAPVTLKYLMEQYNIPLPARLPYGDAKRIDPLDFPVLPNDSGAQPGQ